MIPVFDITRQNKLLQKELDQTIQSVIKSGVFILGPKVAEFEREFANYIGVKYAVGVASGTDAISLALLSLGIGHGDEVIIPANAYPSVFAITTIGAIPKLVDIDPITFDIDPTKISEVITKKTKAILPVHMYGMPADMENISAIGKKYKIPVVEDCAQAVGAATHTGCVLHTPGVWKVWKKVGSIGDVGCFSFYPTKNLGCFGDGGMVATDNKEIYERVKMLRMYGENTRYNSILLGKNSRLDELQAAILSVKLKYLDKWNERRREIAGNYIARLLDCSIANSEVNSVTIKKWNNLQLPFEASFAKHAYHLFVIRSEKRNELKKFLERKGIGTAIHYPVPIHLVPSMEFLGYQKGDFPESEKACKEVLSLPMFPEMRDSEVKQVAGAILQYR